MATSEFHAYESGIGAKEFMAKLQDGSPPEEVIKFAKLYRREILSYINVNAARKFARYVQKRPGIFSKLAPQIINLHPDFICAYFDGIRYAVEDKWNIDLEPVLSLSKQVLEIENLTRSQRKNMLHAVTRVIDVGMEKGLINYTSNHVTEILQYNDC